MRITRPSKCKLCQLWLFLLILLNVSLELQAQVITKTRVPLQKGMTLSAVVAVWGEPEEMIENDIQRQVILHYPQLRNSPASTLRFINGVLAVSEDKKIEFASTGSERRHSFGRINKSIGSQEESQPKTRPTSFMALEDQKMLAEILKDVPSAPDGPAGASPSPGTAAPASPAQFE